MHPRVPVLLAALACACPLSAQRIPRGPHLLRVAASSAGVVLSLDSAAIARTGDSTFVVNAVYDTDRRAHRVESSRRGRPADTLSGRCAITARSVFVH